MGNMSFMFNVHLLCHDLRFITTFALNLDAFNIQVTVPGGAWE